MAGVGEVSLLEGVAVEVIELVFLGFGLGDSVGLPAVESLVTLTGDGPELGVVVVARELDEVLLAVDVDLGDHRLQVVGLLDGRVAVQRPSDASERAGRRRAALADLVVGHEEDRLRGSRRFGGADRGREVASDERVGVAVVGLQAGERLVGVDPGEAEQRRDEVGVVGRDAELAGAAGQQRAGDDERHVQRFLVGDVPLLVHPAVGALHVAVIGGEDHDRVLVGVGVAQRVEDTRDVVADLGLHLVVELQVELVPRLRRDDRAPVVDVALLAGGLRGEVLVARRWLLDVRHL